MNSDWKANCPACGWAYEDSSEILTRLRASQLHGVMVPCPAEAIVVAPRVGQQSILAFGVLS